MNTLLLYNRLMKYRGKVIKLTQNFGMNSPNPVASIYNDPSKKKKLVQNEVYYEINLFCTIILEMENHKENQDENLRK